MQAENKLYHEKPSPGSRQRVNKYRKTSSLVTLFHWLTHFYNVLELFADSTKDHTASNHKVCFYDFVKDRTRIASFACGGCNCARSEVANYERSFISQINVAVEENGL